MKSLKAGIPGLRAVWRSAVWFNWFWPHSLVQEADGGWRTHGVRGRRRLRWKATMALSRVLGVLPRQLGPGRWGHACRSGPPFLFWWSRGLLPSAAAWLIPQSRLRLSGELGLRLRRLALAWRRRLPAGALSALFMGVTAIASPSLTHPGAGELSPTRLETFGTGGAGASGGGGGGGEAAETTGETASIESASAEGLTGFGAGPTFGGPSTGSSSGQAGPFPPTVDLGDPISDFQLAGGDPTTAPGPTDGGAPPAGDPAAGGEGGQPGPDAPGGDTNSDGGFGLGFGGGSGGGGGGGGFGGGGSGGGGGGGPGLPGSPSTDPDPVGPGGGPPPSVTTPPPPTAGPPTTDGPGLGPTFPPAFTPPPGGGPGPGGGPIVDVPEFLIPDGPDGGPGPGVDPGPGPRPPTEIGAGSAAPEASVWAMMILGFGLMGAALRRRRRAETGFQA